MMASDLNYPIIGYCQTTILNDVVQPIMDEYKPAFVQTLKIKKIDLGTIAPLVTGIK